MFLEIEVHITPVEPQIILRAMSINEVTP